jgi:gallate dioxygenase
MARIVGGIGASHTPTIGFAYDRNKRDDPIWAPIFKNFAPLAAWLVEKRPDVLLLIYNDHVSSFFFDHYSAFALGVGPEWRVADEVRVRGTFHQSRDTRSSPRTSGTR